MKRLIEQRYVVRHNILTIIGICLSLYFSWHIVASERSIIRLASLERQIVHTEAELETTRNHRQALESRVVKLRPGSIDPDLLEERARVVLGFTRPGESVVVLPR